jgi:uncharacterized membrane protein
MQLDDRHGSAFLPLAFFDQRLVQRSVECYTRSRAVVENAAGGLRKSAAGGQMRAMSKSRETTLLERLTFFSDAVFAIAITLLVIEIKPPVVHHADDAALGNALLALIPQYIGFLVSFAVIGRFWLGHHRLFGLLARSDDKLIVANLLLLFGIAFMPFPTAVFSDYVNFRTATFLYAAWLVVLGFANWRLIKVALRPELLDQHHDTALAAHIKRGAWLPILIGLFAGAAAFVGSLATLAVLVIGPVVGSYILNIVRRRKLPAPRKGNGR